jgi:thymidylate kinase
MPLAAINHLFDELNQQGIRYCHWKSNFDLDQALEGKGDLDLLIDPQHKEQFKQIIFAQGFKQATDSVGADLEGVNHYFGIDEQSGKSVHLHTYTRIFTGETLTKNYQFPIAELLLDNRTTYSNVSIPTPSAEMVVFTLRMLAKHGSLLEMLLLFRDRKNVAREQAFLFPNIDRVESAKLAANAMESIDEQFFQECIISLETNSSVATRILRGMQLSHRVQSYRRQSVLTLFIERHTTLSRRIWMRTRELRGTKHLEGGGKLIAFLGPEATGKSTLVYETSQWLGKSFQAKSAHLGKPPSTPLTILPNQFLPLGRRLFSRKKTTSTQSRPDERASTSLIYAVRSVLLAWDRLALAKSLHHDVQKGAIVICDRYPSAHIGSMDSARLDPKIIKSNGKFKRRAFEFLGRLEGALYRKIPNPDSVIRLTVPLDVALERNRSRNKNEPAEWVEKRHKEVSVASFEGVAYTEIDTGGTLEDTILKAKKAVWSIL